jgi:hypothetical protein
MANSLAGEGGFALMNRGNASVTVQEVGDRLVIRQGERHLTSYIFLGIWKPYFYPLNGPYGNVVRGVNGSEHSNHYGLSVAYGGHSEGGSTNIWSDWDEPPYGPCGKILHEEFVRIEQHAHYARICENLLYLRPDGTPMARETRDLRVHALPGDEIRVDFLLRVDRPRDEGPKPFILYARVADPMRVLDLRQKEAREKPGKIQNSEGGVNEAGTAQQPARWCDYSGPVDDGTSGIALMDHPRNTGHPAAFFTRDYGLVSLKQYYPAELPDNSLHTLEWSAYVHRGDVEEGKVEEMFQRWAAGG